MLGAAATDDVIDAWAAAYEVLADIFIGREKKIYDTQERIHGWQGFKAFVIDRREICSDNIISLYLKPEDGRPLAAHKPGQYIAIRMTLPNGEPVMRNYSLSDAPGQGYYRISVKREPAPEAEAPNGVFSNYLHDHLGVGDRVELSPPCGEFTLDMPEDEDKALVFIAGGVGVTPLMSMLHAALERSKQTRPIVFIQGALNGGVHAFADELRALRERHPNLHVHVRYREPLDEEAACYFCGPTPMLEHVYHLRHRRGTAERDMHYEFFGPGGSLIG